MRISQSYVHQISYAPSSRLANQGLVQILGFRDCRFWCRFSLRWTRSTVVASAQRKIGSNPYPSLLLALAASIVSLCSTILSRLNVNACYCYLMCIISLLFIFGRKFQQYKCIGFNFCKVFGHTPPSILMFWFWFGTVHRGRVLWQQQFKF